MKTYLIATVILLVASVALVHAQSPVRKETPPLPSFEVASVKLDRSSVPIARYRALDDRFNATLTVRGLIAMAYDCNFDQISGGPQWIKTRFFDIDAKVDENDWAKLSFDQRLDQIKLMVRSLLADRFKLKVIHQTKDLSIYVLALATNGPKFSEDHSRINRERTGITAQGPGQLELVSAPLSKFTNLLAIMPDLEGRQKKAQGGSPGIRGRQSPSVL